VHDGEVEREQVPVRQHPVVRHAVQDRVVHGGADVVAERTASERGRVVDVAGRGAGGGDHLGGPPVQVEQVRADGRTAPQGLQDVGDQGAGSACPGELGRGEDLDHAGASVPIVIPVLL
jgi:hypothetical protein